MECESYNPDSSFSSFKIVEFPLTFVGLSSALELNLGVDLDKSAYLKTTYNGEWMKFIDAKKVSAHHSAFTIEQKNAFSIRIKFQPTKDSILWAKSNKQFDDTFFFDLRLIKLDGAQCCYKESHAEVGRYYVIGQCENCSITHFPNIIDFGDVIIKSKVSRCINITNNSSRIPANIQFKKCPCFVIEPEKVTVNANSTKRICVYLTPRSFDIAKIIYAKIRNNHNLPEYLKEIYIPYSITIHRNIILQKDPRQVAVESLHRLYEPNPDYTYIDKEIDKYKKKQEIALDILKSSKILSNKRAIKKESNIYPKERCNIFMSHEKIMSTEGFCKEDDDLKISMYDVFQISILPLPVDFGQVSVESYAEQEITIKNNSQFNINIMFLNNNHISYTENKSETYKQKILALNEAKIKIYYYGIIRGQFKGTFQFTVDKKYTRTHSYVAHVSYPKLMVQDKDLRFGMVTSEKFVMSVPVRIENNFNVNIDFQWHGLDSDIPFEIMPISGSVPKRSCRICNIIYVSKPIKTRIFEIELISKRGTSIKVIPFELNVLTKKLSVAFTQPLVSFKDIPLNIATSLEVKLENSSKEFFYFSVEEPLLPGIFIKPMVGTIRPKTIVNFEITVKISCVLEFNFDIYFKINNKENISLTVTGNVLEPKIAIHPKSIIMPRIPSNMKTYIPIKLQNLGILKSIVNIVQNKLDKTACNFVPIDVLAEIDTEKQKVTEICLDKGQTKTVYIEIFGPSLIEYDSYGPFQINGILGPPNSEHSSLALQYYTGEYEKLYENSAKAKSVHTHKEISYLHMTGVITKEWIRFSIDKFHFIYEVGGTNLKEFTMTNVTKNILNIHISTSKLFPNFTLKCNEDTSKDTTMIEFEINPGHEASFFLKFHPRRHGRFTSTAVLYLNKNLSVPFNNLTFTGNRQRVPLLTANVKIVIFPPCVVTEKLHREVVLTLEGAATMESFFSSHPQKTIEVTFLTAEIKKELDEIFTILYVKISVTREVTQEKNLSLRFHHESGAMCEIEISVCFTHCPLTTHVSNLVNPYNNPYPYYPSMDQSELYDYMETCIHFLEMWLFNQGFRNDFYPSIPDSLYALSTISHTKHKGMNISYLNFIRRIAGPLVKRICKIPTKALVEESILVHEIHDIYVEIIRLLRSRGSNMWVINPKYLLSHHQFVVYTNNVAPKGNVDILMTRELVKDAEKFRRLSKQSWMDFILQTYRVFVLNSCFFDCVCVSGQDRDIIRILQEWYNSQILAKHQQLRGNSRSIKVIRNITTDLSDGIAIISALLYNCPFLQEHFSNFCELEEDDTESIIIHNACLIVAAFKQLRISFPLNSHQLLKPNFIQMLFLSIHLYVVLPMFKPREVIKFKPSLLKTSQRLVSISPETPETLIFDYIIFNNEKNGFVVEKSAASESGNKTYLSIRYTANFVASQKSILLVYGYNKTRIFDTYIVFLLEGGICSLEPLKRCKISGHLYRPTKVEILVPSPFKTTAVFEVFIVNTEPVIPVNFEQTKKPCFFARRLILVDREVEIKPSQIQKENEEGAGQRLPLKLVCLNAITKNYFIWFRSNIGEFYLKVVTMPRLDWPVETLTAKLNEWPPTPCSCEGECECYRTSIVLIPHRNDLMVKALRLALQEYASDVMLDIFDRLIEQPTGRLVLTMMFVEGGMNISSLTHILRNEIVYQIKSKNLQPKIKSVTLQPNSDAVLSLPVTLRAQDEAERYNIMLASECGMDVRTYRVNFIASQNWHECFEANNNC